MTRLEAIQKVKKMLRLAHDAEQNGHTRSAAIMAKSLIRKFRITQEEIDYEELVRESFFPISIMSLWEGALSDACAIIHECRSFTRNNICYIEGSRADLYLFRQCYQHWRDTIELHARDLYGPRWKGDTHGSFAVGYAVALQHRADVINEAKRQREQARERSQTPPPRPTVKAGVSPVETKDTQQPTQHKKTETDSSEADQKPEIDDIPYMHRVEASKINKNAAKWGYIHGASVNFQRFKPLLEKSSVPTYQTAQCGTGSLFNEWH